MAAARTAGVTCAPNASATVTMTTYAEAARSAAACHWVFAAAVNDVAAAAAAAVALLRLGAMRALYYDTISYGSAISASIIERLYYADFEADSTSTAALSALPQALPDRGVTRGLARLSQWPQAFRHNSSTFRVIRLLLPGSYAVSKGWFPCFGSTSLRSKGRETVCS
jgi:hypothetical protein